jgi:hypothetical protein
VIAPAYGSPHNPDTDWFRDAGWGVFVHYLWDVQNVGKRENAQGKPPTTWDALVHEFDTEKFAEQVKETGAPYVFFTMMQRTRYLIAPNATYDKLTGYKPGEACATRDLVADLHRSLDKRGIKFMLYWTGDGPREDAQAAKGLGGWDGRVSDQYVNNWADVVAEYSRRYGDRVKGWWVDGCYAHIGYNEQRWRILAKALKAGNPRAIIALKPDGDHQRGGQMSVAELEVYTTENAGRESAGALLPSGFLCARGSHIVGPDGSPVRIASVGLTGMNVVGGRLQLAGPFKGIDGHIAAMRAMGFNCVRVDWIDKTLDDTGAMAQLDAFVGACKKAELKVVFDNHNNEATPADWENAAQQKNGLWFDTGPGTDGTDGAGNKGTVSAAKFQENWVTFAKHWAGNSTVIGFDIRNEPCAHTKTPALWGGKGPTDIHAMYEAVGNAILAVNPNVLIICEAVINYKIGAFQGDLSVVRNLPVVLSNPTKLVYSVHEYPKEIGGYRGPESGPGYIERMNKMWGWLITENVAPVWIGEMGASMTSGASKAWGQTLLGYMNGEAPGGPTFSGRERPIGGDWWAWGCLTGQNPNGCVGEDGKVRPEQAPFINQMLFHPGSSSH